MGFEFGGAAIVAASFYVGFDRHSDTSLHVLQKARALTLDPTIEAERLGKEIEEAIALIPANLSKPSNKTVR